MNTILEKLADDESKWVFGLLQDFEKKSDKWKFAKAVINRHNDVKFPEIENILKETNCRNIVIVDFDEGMQNYAEILCKAGYSAVYVNCWEKTLEFLNDDISFFVFKEEVYKKMPKEYKERTYYSNRRYHGRLGNQYFDVFSPGDNELFIDIGAFQGETTLDFVNWCNGNYKYIYMFEPNIETHRICQNNIKKSGVENCKLFNLAVWDKCELKRFDTSYNFRQMAHIDENGETIVKTTTLDNIIDNSCVVTFIKIDSEGAEKNIIEGAKEIIKRSQPKLAVSVYHNPSDYFDIAKQIIEINPNYKLYYRQYHTDPKETILYAEV